MPMAYCAEISRNNPSLIVFLLDQSRSMGQKLVEDSSTRTKAQGVADAINRLIQDLVIKSTKADGVRDYFWIFAIGYGYPGGPLFPNAPFDSPIPISKIADSPSRIEERTRLTDSGEPIVTRIPVWVDPQSYGWTEMCKSLNVACDVVKNWRKCYPKAFPPVIFNLTDGGATDGDPRISGSLILETQFEDGAPLLFNLHLSTRSTNIIKYPVTRDELPEKHAKTMFDMSSQLPDFAIQAIKTYGESVRNGARGMVYNADLRSIITLLNVGTVAAQTMVLR